jgi:hypothetical protein
MRLGQRRCLAADAAISWCTVGLTSPVKASRFIVVAVGAVRAFSCSFMFRQVEGLETPYQVPCTPAVIVTTVTPVDGSSHGTESSGQHPARTAKVGAASMR